MGKKPQKCRKNCTKHSFNLKPVSYFAYISRGVEVSFCPPTLRHASIFPVFNTDRKHYTAAFFLPQEQGKFVLNDAVYRKEHQNFCGEQLHGKEEILVPKPRSKTPYCHICKDHYEDYSDVILIAMKHIKSGGHKLAINSNKFSGYIDELASERYGDNQMIAENSSELHHEESYSEKQINSNTTLPSSLNLEQPALQNAAPTTMNQGFTFVSGCGLSLGLGQRTLDNAKIRRLQSEGLLGQREALSPHFEKLVRRASTATQMGSERKSEGLGKFPIIVMPIE